MKMIGNMKAIAVSAIVLTSLSLPIAAQQPAKIDFSNETIGSEPKSLVAVVGIWRIENEDGKNVLAVNGRQWKEGQSSAGVADKARALYGERYAEFLDRFRLMPTTPTLSPRMSIISGATKSPYGSKDYRGASTKAPAYCSI
jgi:hypothetical protein